MKLKFSASFHLPLILLLASPGSSGYKMGAGAPVRVSKPSMRPSPGRQIDEGNVLSSLSERFKVPMDRLRYYRQLHYGYEELVPALIVSREAKVEVGKILKDRSDGKSWKNISNATFVPLQPLNDEVLNVLKPIRKALPKSLLTEKPTARP